MLKKSRMRGEVISGIIYIWVSFYLAQYPPNTKSKNSLATVRRPLHLPSRRQEVTKRCQ